MSFHKVIKLAWSVGICFLKVGLHKLIAIITMYLKEASERFGDPAFLNSLVVTD